MQAKQLPAVVHGLRHELQRHLLLQAERDVRESGRAE
jgi:hypothetical protein